ncbi:hypothetical protein HanPSC8_Chr13g0571671 [Helianthus annuus]|nr:hypothetical protein HanPSC8_Chr13g0571671 [Helianthus annuus]
MYSKNEKCRDKWKSIYPSQVTFSLKRSVQQTNTNVTIADRNP